MAPRLPRPNKSTRRARRLERFAGLRCEQLEDRVVPALFDVLSPQSFTGLNNNGCVAVTDFDKDGLPDAVLTNFGTNYAGGAGTTITILYGDEDGGFDRIQHPTNGFNVSFASIADINGDTWPDLVVSNANKQNTGSITVFQNTNGNLSQVGTPFSTFGRNTSWVGLADMTGDGELDVVAASFGADDGTGEDFEGNNVTIFEGNGDFTFSANPATTLAPELQFVPTALALADFDGNGNVDIAASVPGIPPDFGNPYPPGSIYVFRSTGSGGFADPSQYDTGGVLPVNIQAADVNGDGKPDLVVANAGDPNDNPEFNHDGIGVVLNVSTPGNVNFGTTDDLSTNTYGTFAVAVADFDVDGDADIAAINYGSQGLSPAAFVSIYTGDGSGEFDPGSPGTYDTETSLGGGQYLAVGDFDTNGTPDLIVAHASNLVGVLLNTSTPQISTTTTLTTSGSPTTYNDSVTFTATVTPASGTAAGGTVTFFDNGIQMGLPVTLTSQQAAFTTNTLTVGTHAITATYSGAPGFAGSTSGPLSQVVIAGPAATFTMSGVPFTTLAGASFNFTVTARDQFGNLANSYRGAVHFTSSDGQAVLPPDYTFTATDNGVHTFTMTLRTAGAQSFTATDIVTSSITGTGNINVFAAAASQFTVAGFPSSTIAGAVDSFTVTAKDVFGNLANGYVGTVHFTSSDGQGDLPIDYTFIGPDNGVHTFEATLYTAGVQSITATDTTTASINGSQSGIIVTAASAATLTFTGLPTSVTEGVAQDFTVTAKDAFGNTATGYRGTVHFTSSDGLAILPADYAFTAGDAGSHTFSATLSTPGSQSITATDTVTGSITGNATTTVTSASATHFEVSAPPTATAGSSFTVTVTALNSANATATGYRGTVHFTSGDGQAILPADYTFTATDAGTHTFTITLSTAGSQSITATDTTTGSITGNDSTIVGAAAATNFLVVAPTTATAGTAFTATVTARDAFGNTAIGYRGTVHFTSSDGLAVLPSDYTFTAGDSGVHSFSITLNTAGVQSVVATDTTTGSITGSDTVTVGTSPPPPPPPPTAQRFAVGTVPGTVATVTLYNPDNTVRFATQPFGSSYRRGVRVAAGDVTGDGIVDVVAVTNGGIRAKARVIDGNTGTVLANNLLGNPQYKGPVSVAVGDVNGDGIADIALGTNQGGRPRVRLVNGGDFTKLAGFFAGPAANFLGRTNVALGDMTGDGKADLVVTSLHGGLSRVVGYNGASLAPGLVPQTAFPRFVLGGKYVSGLFLSLGDVNGDSRADIVIGTPAKKGPSVTVFSGDALVDDNVRAKIATFTPAGSTGKNGMRVAVRDIDGDGKQDILTSSGETVSAFKGGSGLPISGLPPLLFAFDPNPAVNGGVWVG